MGWAEKDYRRMTTQERREHNAFFSGYCCALSAACYGDDGTGTEYMEAVAAVGARELLNYARREDDMELPKIRRAVKAIENREARLSCAARQPRKEGE